MRFILLEAVEPQLAEGDRGMQYFIKAYLTNGGILIGNKRDRCKYRSHCTGTEGKTVNTRPTNQPIIDSGFMDSIYCRILFCDGIQDI